LSNFVEAPNDVDVTAMPNHRHNSMPAVMAAGPAVMQNLLFVHQQWPKSSPELIAPVHGGMARLSWHGG